MFREKLQTVFGDGQVQGVASQAGMRPGYFPSQLGQHLTGAVDGMTLNGRLPDEDSSST